MSCRLRTDNSLKVPIFSCFATCKIPCAEIRTFLPVYVDNDSHFFSKAVKIGAGYVAESPRCICDKKTKHVLAPVRRCNPWGNFPRISCVSAHRDPSVIFSVSSRSVQGFAKISEKNPPETPRVNTIHCLSKKVPTFKLSVTLSNLNRFSKFLHCWKAYEICYKPHTTLPTSP